MSCRALISLFCIRYGWHACLATISTDAFAYRRGVAVGRAGVYHGAAVRRGVAVGVGAAAAAAGAYCAPGYYGAPAAVGCGYGYYYYPPYNRCVPTP
jgi:hypothetical protein